VLWPISIPVAYFLCQKIFGDLPFFSVGFFIPFCVFVLLGATIISSVTVKMNLDVRRLSDTEILEQALKNGKLSLVKKYWDPAENTSYSFGDPLDIALENKQSSAATYLLEQGVNPKKYAQNIAYLEPGLTPLHTAVKKGMTEAVKKLIELGADPNATTDDGQTPLHNLGQMDKEMLPVLEVLKTSGANFAATDKDGNTPLITLVKINAPLEHRPLLVRKLIEYGCPTDIKNLKGETALSIVQSEQPYEKELITILSAGAQF